jgi:hypothetical protein
MGAQCRSAAHVRARRFRARRDATTIAHRMGVQIKGSAVTARLRFVRELYGEPGVRRVKEALSPEHRAIIEKRVMPHEWAPFELFVELSVEIDRLYGKGDLALCREMGRFAAKVNLPTLYRIFYALGSPAFIITRAVRVWDVHYDSGRISADIERSAKTERATLTLRSFGTPHRAHCLSVLGWAERSVELSGGQIVEADETTCRTRGDDACRFVIAWTA